MRAYIYSEENSSTDLLVKFRDCFALSRIFLYYSFSLAPCNPLHPCNVSLVPTLQCNSGRRDKLSFSSVLSGWVLCLEQSLVFWLGQLTILRLDKQTHQVLCSVL